MSKQEPNPIEQTVPPPPVLSPEELAIYQAVQEAEVSEPALLKVREMVEQMNLNQEQADLLLRKFAELAVLQRYANMTTEEFCLAMDGAKLQNKMKGEHEQPLPSASTPGAVQRKIVTKATEADFQAAVKVSKMAKRMKNASK